MRKFLSIAVLNVKQGIRQKTFWVINLFFLFLLMFSAFLGELSIGEKSIVLKSISLSSIEISCLFLIIFGLVYNFYREKDSRLQEVYLSYVSPLNYIGGKLAGYIFICLIYILLTSILAGIILLLNKSFHWNFFVGSYGIFLKLSLFCGICLIFSSFFDSPLLTSIVTLFTYVTSEFAYSAVKIVNVSESVFTKLFFKFLYHLLPNADKIDLKINAIHGENISWFLLGSITAYALIYILLTFFITTFIFLGKEH